MNIRNTIFIILNKHFDSDMETLNQNAIADEVENIFSSQLTTLEEEIKKKMDIIEEHMRTKNCYPASLIWNRIEGMWSSYKECLYLVKGMK